MPVPSSYTNRAESFRCDAIECRNQGNQAPQWCVRLAHMRIAGAYRALAVEMDIAAGLGMQTPTARGHDRDTKPPDGLWRAR